MTTTDRGERISEVEAAILGVARDLLAEGGPGALAMRTVADKVGITATAIYHYFESKQHLVNRVVTSGFNRFGEYLERYLMRYPAGTLDRVAAVGEAYIDFAMENREYFRVLFSIQGDAPREVGDLHQGRGHDLLRQAILEAMESGAIRRADPDAVLLYLWACVHGLVTLVMAGKVGCECDDGCESRIPATPTEIFQIFRTFIRDGLSGTARSGQTE